MSNRLGQKAPADAAIRMLTRIDTHHFEGHLLRLTNHCRRLRFGGEITDRFLQDYARHVDLTNTVVLGAFVNGVMVAAAELRSFQANWCEKAEAAFSVEVANRSCGVGTKLMHGLLAAAREARSERNIPRTASSQSCDAKDSGGRARGLPSRRPRP